MLSNLCDALCGGDHLPQMLKCAGYRRQCFKRRQRAEDKQRNQRPRLSIAANACGGEPQHSNNRNTANQQHQRLGERGQLSLATLRIQPARFRFFHLLPVAVAGVEQHEFRLSLEP